jgi:hypothetical protein
MDYAAIAVIGTIVLAALVSNRYHTRTRAGSPGYQYQRVITVGMLGLWLTVAGAIGWDVSHVHGLFQGTTWVDGPIWWQVGTGAALLGCAVFLARRVPSDATRSSVP